MHISISARILFQFTTSQGGRRRLSLGYHRQKYFNSRPHKEVDSSYFLVFLFAFYFNSRPHKEVDGISKSVSFTISNISIHDLTRRSTVFDRPLSRLRTHFNSRPHKEVDVPSPGTHCDWNVFQFTTSQGGRPRLLPPSQMLSGNFNSRPHKEVD